MRRENEIAAVAKCDCDLNELLEKKRGQTGVGKIVGILKTSNTSGFVYCDTHRVFIQFVCEGWIQPKRDA